MNAGADMEISHVSICLAYACYHMTSVHPLSEEILSSSFIVPTAQLSTQKDKRLTLCRLGRACVTDYGFHEEILERFIEVIDFLFVGVFV
jgi:hypothetical protein